MNDNEGVEEFEANGGHNKEVHRRDIREMIAKKGSPSLTRRKISLFLHVFGDSRLSDVETEFQKFAMDPGRPPERIFVIHKPDKRA